MPDEKNNIDRTDPRYQIVRAEVRHILGEFLAEEAAKKPLKDAPAKTPVITTPQTSDEGFNFFGLFGSR